MIRSNNSQKKFKHPKSKNSDKSILPSKIHSDKSILPSKIHKVLIKLKSLAFMKIFMAESRRHKKSQKVRSYDLESEAISSMSCCIKKKIQQIYLRTFLQFKNLVESKQSIKIKTIKSTGVKSQSRIKQQTPILSRLNFCKDKAESTIVGKAQIYNYTDRSYKSEFQISKISSKSNIEGLYYKLKEVNLKSKIQKQNFSRVEDIQEMSRIQKATSESFGKETIRNSKIIKKHNFNNTVQSKIFENKRLFYNPTYQNCPSVYKKQQLQYPNAIYGKKQKTISRKKNNEVFYSRKEEYYKQNCNFYPLSQQNLKEMKKWQQIEKRNLVLMKIQQLQRTIRQDLIHVNLSQNQYQYLPTDSNYNSTNNFQQKNGFFNTNKQQFTYSCPPHHGNHIYSPHTSWAEMSLTPNIISFSNLVQRAGYRNNKC